MSQHSTLDSYTCCADEWVSSDTSFVIFGWAPMSSPFCGMSSQCFEWSTLAFCPLPMREPDCGQSMRGLGATRRVATLRLEIKRKGQRVGIRKREKRYLVQRPNRVSIFVRGPVVVSIITGTGNSITVVLHFRELPPTRTRVRRRFTICHIRGIVGLHSLRARQRQQSHEATREGGG